MACESLLQYYVQAYDSHMTVLQTSYQPRHKTFHSHATFSKHFGYKSINHVSQSESRIENIYNLIGWHTPATRCDKNSEKKYSTNLQDNEADLRNIHEEALEQLPDVLLCERLFVVHLRVNVAVV